MRLQNIIYLAFILTVSCGSPGDPGGGSHLATITNKLERPRKDALVQLDADKLGQVADWAAVKLVANGETIPFEALDLNGDGHPEQLGLLLQMAAGEQKSISIKTLAKGEKPPVFKKRTQAEISHKTGGYWKDREYLEGSFKNVDDLRVPPEHTDHSWFIRYEGPGWESDLVGYRFYLDWRNATDVFGKKTSDMVLQQVGLDGFDSYHEPADWGQDILKVGKSLGVGSLGTWTGDRALRVEETDSLSCRILKNGLLESTVRTKYHGWKVGDKATDLLVDLSIQAGSRLTKSEVTLSSPLDNLCTGIGKLNNSQLLQGEAGEWAYLATWGAQSLANDQLGLAVLYRKKDLKKVTEDEFSNVVVLQPKNKALTYYFLAAWEQEKGGITSKEAFLAYLEVVLQELSHPLTIAT